MESSNIKHEDEANQGNINIPLATSSLERKMMEYIAAQKLRFCKQWLKPWLRFISPLQSKLHFLKITIRSPMITIKT
jgi:hypothetical protein